MEKKIARELAISIGEEDTGLAIMFIQHYFESLSNEDFTTKYGKIFREKVIHEIKGIPYVEPIKIGTFLKINGDHFEVMVEEEGGEKRLISYFGHLKYCKDFQPKTGDKVIITEDEWLLKKE